MKRGALKQLIKEVIQEDMNLPTFDYIVKFTVDTHDAAGKPHEKEFEFKLKFTDMYQALDYVTNTPHVIKPHQKVLNFSITQSSWGVHHHKSWEE